MRGGYGGSGRGRGRSSGPSFGGPKLPAALREQVEDAIGKPAQRGRFQTRKDRRKNERTDKKQFRAQYQQQGGRSRDEAQDDDEADAVQLEPVSKKRKVNPSNEDRQPESTPMQQSPSVPDRKKKKKKKPELRLPDDKAGDPEDGEIEWLEYMLKKKPSEDDALDDGLDDLLDFADQIGPGGLGLQRDAGARSPGSSLSDNGLLEDDESDSVDGLQDEDVSDAYEGERDEVQSSDDERDSADDGEEGDATNSNLEGEGRDGTDEDELAQAQGSVQADGSITAISTEPEVPAGPSRYVPPQVRAAQLAAKAAADQDKVQEHAALVRKLQGLLNRLSERNIAAILADIEGLYRDHSRNEMTTSLTELIIQSIADKAALLDSFVIPYATLAGALHRVIGVEFGAHMVHSVIMRYQASRGKVHQDTTAAPTSIYETPDASKESLNLLTLISELYNAQVVAAKLIYDLVLEFINTEPEDGSVLGEREVEGLLRIMKCSGSQLRTDDPASLKDIINLVQEKTVGKEKTMTTRARFMVETLANLRSGKSKSKGGLGSDATEEMRRFLKGLGRTRRLMTYEPLRVSLSDLLNADTRGKWWLVGAGWSGNPLVEHQESKAKASTAAKSKPIAEDQTATLLALARKQGMNNDIRQNIFLVLMTCEDYKHACDRFSQLRLTEKQQRDLVRVPLHCLSLEAAYNPYYTLVLNYLCAESISHRVTLQYALWDFMEKLAAADSDTKAMMRSAQCVAKAMAYIIARGSLDLTVFKKLDFTSLSSMSSKFVSTCLSELVIGTQTASPLLRLPPAFSAETYDVEAVVHVFERALSHEGVTHGLTYILKSLQKRTSQDTVRDQVLAAGTRTALSALTGATVL